MMEELPKSAEQLAEENARLHARLAELAHAYAGRVRAEEQLLESEKRNLLLLESIHDVLWAMDMNLRYTYVSPSVERMRGFTVEEVMGQSLDEAFAPGSLDHVNRSFTAIRAEALLGRANLGESKSLEVEMTCKDGSTLWTEMVVTLLCDASGTPIQITGVTREISERKRAEDARRIASRMEATATLAGGIAHDFNNLMAAVLGNAAIMKMQLGEEHYSAPLLRDIEEAAERVSTLSTQMLAFARGGKYEPKPLNLNQTITSVIDIHQGTLPERIRVITDLEPGLQSVQGDATQMGQVLFSLFQNAIEAIGVKGTVRFTSRNLEIDESFAEDYPGMQPGPYIHLLVEDSGHGMDGETLSKVFEPYFTTKARGRGLALAAAYGIIKNHSGFIYVESTKGKGSSLRIFLPATEVQSARPPRVEKGPSEGTETVLIIDDEEMVMSATKRSLEFFGYNVVCARNGEEAVEVARTFPTEIQVALLDLAMPIMGGAEAFPLLKRARPHMKVIICSGYELDQTSQTLLDAGADAFLHKPFRPSQLGQEIRKALDVQA